MYCFEPRSTIGPGRELRIKEVACCSEFEFRSRWRADFKFRPRSRETKFRGGAVRGVSLICVCVARLPRCDRGGHGSNRRSHEWQSRRNQSGCSQINADVAADAGPRSSAKTGGKYAGLSLLFFAAAEELPFGAVHANDPWCWADSQYARSSCIPQLFRCYTLPLSTTFFQGSSLRLSYLPFLILLHKLESRDDESAPTGAIELHNHNQRKEAGNLISYREGRRRGEVVTFFRGCPRARARRMSESPASKRQRY